MLQLLISTVNNHFLNRRYIPPFFDYLVINQLDENTERQDPDCNNIFSYKEKGLSKSRNKALEKTTADICLISDDDTTFCNDTYEIIVTAFNENPLADIITFQTNTPQGTPFKKYHPKKRWLNSLSAMRVTSFEIAFRTKSIATAGLRFDENFGLCAYFPTGEENIFLLDALRKGLKILYIPAPIVIHSEKSSGGNFNDTNLVKAKGAMLYRMFGQWSYLLSLFFSIKKCCLSEFNVFRFYYLMLEGIKEYKAIL